MMEILENNENLLIPIIKTYWKAVVIETSSFFLHFFFLGRAMLGLCCFTGFSRVAVMWGYSGCSAWASHHSGFSSCGAWAPEHIGFSSCDSWALGAGSAVVMHRLSSSTHVGSSWTRD